MVFTRNRGLEAGRMPFNILSVGDQDYLDQPRIRTCSHHAGCKTALLHLRRDVQVLTGYLDWYQWRALGPTRIEPLGRLHDGHLLIRLEWPGPRGHGAFL